MFIIIDKKIQYFDSFQIYTRYLKNNDD